MSDLRNVAISHAISITYRHFNNSLETGPLVFGKLLTSLPSLLLHLLRDIYVKPTIDFIQNTSSGSGDTLFLPLLTPSPISSSHDWYKQLLSGDASIISVERNEHANHQQTARCVLKHPKRERKKKTTLGHVTARSRTNKYQKYICVLRVRERIALLVSSRLLKFYKSTIENLR